MAYFDFLIDKNNKESINGMEYIYNFHLKWLVNNMTSFDIERGTIVINVKKQENNSFIFNIKGDDTNTIYTTNYGWAFIENTDENSIKYIEYLILEKEIEHLQKEKDLLFKTIKSLV